MRIRSLPTLPRLLRLLLLQLNVRFHHPRLIRRRQAKPLQLLRQRPGFRQPDLVPHGPELVVDVEAQRGVVRPDHAGVVVLFVARHEELALAFELVDGFFGAGPAVAKGADVEALCRRLGLQVAEELRGGADVVDGAEGEGADSIGAGAVEVDFLVVLEDGADGAFVVVFSVLEGEVGEQVL